MEKQRREKMKVDCGTWLITLLNKAFYRMKKVARKKIRVDFTSWLCLAKSRTRQVCLVNL